MQRERERFVLAQRRGELARDARSHDEVAVAVRAPREREALLETVDARLVVFGHARRVLELEREVARPAERGVEIDAAASNRALWSGPTARNSPSSSQTRGAHHGDGRRRMGPRCDCAREDDCAATSANGSTTTSARHERCMGISFRERASGQRAHVACAAIVLAEAPQRRHPARPRSISGVEFRVTLRTPVDPSGP